MEFENLNETGSIQAANDNETVFHFQYANDFYGSGTFIAPVLEMGNSALELATDDLKWGDYHLRRGSLEGLAQSAKVFFSRELCRYSSLGELRGTLLRLDESIVNRPPFLSFLRWRNLT